MNGLSLTLKNASAALRAKMGIEMKKAKILGRKVKRRTQIPTPPAT
jgi:hypothetical protein